MLQYIVRCCEGSKEYIFQNWLGRPVELLHILEERQSLVGHIIPFISVYTQSQNIGDAIEDNGRNTPFVMSRKSNC